jgi:hypothetical protein
VYLVDTKFSAQDVLRTRHDRLPPMEKKSRIMCVKVLGIFNRG